MFDLFRSQRKTVKYVLTAILSLVALSMVVTLIPNVFSGADPTMTGEIVLVKVGDETVTPLDLNMAMRDYITADTPAESMAFMARQVIDNLIEEKVLMQEAAALGVKPTESELALWIKDQMPFLFEGGSFNGEQYRMLIQQRFQLSVPQFEYNLLKDLTIEQRLRQLVTDNIVVTDEEVRKLFLARNEQIKVEYSVVNIADFRSQVQATDAKIAEYFEANRFRYNLQETRRLQIYEVNDAAAPEVQVSDAEISTFYNQNRYRFETPERVMARHILFTTVNLDSGEELPESEVEAKRAKAEEAAAKVKQGGDFQALVKEYSEDAGTVDSGGDLGWVVRGQTPAEFEEAAFALAPGETSGVVKTDLGFHIIKVEKKDSPQLRSLDEARDEIIADLRAEKEQTTRNDRLDQIMAAVGAGAESPEALSQRYGLTFQVFDNVERRTIPVELGSMPRFVGDLFSEPAGGVVTGVNEEDGTMYIGKVVSISPARQAELAEMRDRVREDYIAAEARKLAQEKAATLLAQAREAGSLSQAARALGLRTQTSDFIKRDGQIPGFTSGQALGNAAFDAEVGTIQGPVPAGEGVGVYEVAAKQEADLTELLNQRADLRQSILDARQNETFGLFRGLTVKRYEEQGKITRYEDRITELINQIRRS